MLQKNKIPAMLQKNKIPGMLKDKNSPIGIFDSGMGGLTVFNAIAHCLPFENLIYFGDTAHLPYGNKSQGAVEKYSMAIADFLCRLKIKLLVVACNTASVYAIERLKKELSIPVIGVVDSGVNAALAAAENSIGVIGTLATISSAVYEKKIRSKNPSLKIYSRSCPLFVPLVEEGWRDHSVTGEIADIYLKDLRGKIDTVILACTHYPLIKDVVHKALGSNVIIIDSAREVAITVEKKLNELCIASGGNNVRQFKFYVSDAPGIFKERGQQFLEYKIEKVDLIEVRGCQ